MRHPLFVTLTALLLAATAHAEDDFVHNFTDRVHRLSCSPPSAVVEPLLRVMTLNIAHGRSDGPNQIFLDKPTFVANLNDITRLLENSRADIVALQEVDGPSRWSGMFDHARLLAERAAYPWRFRGDHAHSWLYRYGTAVLSRLPLSASRSHRFAPTPLTPRKGLVVSEVQLPGDTDDQAGSTVDVMSVHFDFLSRRAKHRQLDELLAVLAERDSPTILLGDFNSSWDRDDSVIRELLAATGLSAYEPESQRLATHGDERIDWILISSEFRFERYRVLPQIVSDHQAVVADIGFSADSPLRPDCMAAAAALPMAASSP